MTPSATAACNPDWGKPWADVSYRLPDGRRVWMYRKGQKVRFFTAEGEQVGPEQANVAPAVAYALAQHWREVRNNPREIKERLLSWNPSPLPVIQPGVVPRLLTGQRGRRAVFVYRGWEIEVYHPGFLSPATAWRVVAKQHPPRAGLASAWGATFDGAVCVGKILVDFESAVDALPTPDALPLIGMWQNIGRIMDDMDRARSPVTRATVARQIEYERSRGIVRTPANTIVWFHALPLPQRIRLIDDRLAFRYCVQH